MRIFTDLFEAIWIKVMGIGSKVIWNDEEGAAILPPERYKQMAFGGPMFVMNYEYMDSIETGTLVETRKPGLRSSWSIKDHDSAIETMDWIFNEGHRTQVDLILQVIHQAPPEQHADILAKMAETPGEENDNYWGYQYNIIQRCIELFNKNKFTRHKPLPRSIAAWDYVRAVAVARWSHECGYLNEEEMWYYIEEAQQRAEEEFSGWEE